VSPDQLRAHVVVPAGIDDSRRPSGGNVYDRHLVDGIVSLGWSLAVHESPGAWPCADERALLDLSRLLDGMPDGSTVLVDGLVASGVPEVLVPHSRRLRVVVLLHMPLGGRGDQSATRREQSALAAAAAVVTTSHWARDRVLSLHSLPPDRVHVAEPGVSRAAVVSGTPGGENLLCVAALLPDKGHVVLLDALAKLADLAWDLVCVGSRDRDAAYADQLAAQAEALAIGSRVRFVGTQRGETLAASYAGADVLVLASRTESYGMVVTEALARGLPVIATSVGGVPEAVGKLSDGRRPALLVPAEDAGALADAVRRWLENADLRATLRECARARRHSLRGWEATSKQVAHVLAGVGR
jgi:glycosyltransferase involved in cell wall biosynthesis